MPAVLDKTKEVSMGEAYIIFMHYMKTQFPYIFSSFSKDRIKELEQHLKNVSIKLKKSIREWEDDFYTFLKN